jgi:glutamate dehydrogenase
MITEDPQRRAARLQELLELLKRQAAPEDRELLLAFAPVAYAETPDRVAFGLTLEALAARISDHFRFVVREMPPPTQLYKGLPGIHVAVRNPPESAWVRQGPGDGLPSEVTVVETHTLDAPFIFESLKNYFRKAGLRVFSAIHPILTARRQWERIVWVGGPHEEGSKECYCYFQIERIEQKERRRHIEHEIFSVLKCLFVSVEDFKDMLGAVGAAARELRSRDGKTGEVESARAFLDWLQREARVDDAHHA